MTKDQYLQERGKQAGQNRFTNTASMKAGDQPKKDKVCLQLVKIKYSHFV